MPPELEQFYEQVEDLEIAMMTTIRPDGHLESRAMATQKRAAGADLWFVSAKDTAKVRDVAADPHVNLAYYKDRTREWISVSGLATLSDDREKIRELYGCTSPTGRSGSATRATSGTGRPTTRASC
jgi:general stress protein 26